MAVEDYTPEEWLDFLEREFMLRLPKHIEYDEYYRGEHPLAFATSKFREAFGDLFREFADNFCDLVVDVPVDKLQVEGFDFGSDEANAKAWELWEAQGLDSRESIVYTEAGKHGTAFLLVDPILKRITIEHPLFCYVELDPADPMKRLAGFKKWEDIDGTVHAAVYLPDRIYFYDWQDADASPPENTPLIARASVDVSAAGWQPSRDVPNTLGVVPLIPIENNPGLVTGQGKSDLTVVIPLQNGINKLVTDMIVASEYTAFRQRVLTGVEVPKYPEGHPMEGEPIPNADLMASISRTWFIEESEAKVHELGGVDFAPYIGGVEMLVQHVAIKVRIPVQYFLASSSTLANIAAESMAIINDGFGAKIVRKQKGFGLGVAEAMFLLLKANGVTVDGPGRISWAQVFETPLQAAAPALMALKGLNVPLEWLWMQLPGVTQEVADDWRAQMNKRQAAAPPQIVLPPGVQPPQPGQPGQPGVTPPQFQPGYVPGQPTAPVAGSSS